MSTLGSLNTLFEVRTWPDTNFRKRAQPEFQKTIKAKHSDSFLDSECCLPFTKNLKNMV